MSAKRVPRKKTVTKYSDHYRRAEGMTQTTISLEKALLDEIKEAAADDDRSHRGDGAEGAEAKETVGN